jgi:uncharacterized protein (TIGR03067 family)
MLCRSLVLLPLFVVLTTGTVRSGDKKEQEKLEGTWTAVEFEGGATKNEKKIKVTFKADTITLMDGDKKEIAKYSVDPSKKPKAMDVTLEKGGEKHTTLLIYDLDGDNLKVCHFEGKEGSETRPKEFAANKDSILVKFKRDKK